MSNTSPSGYILPVDIPDIQYFHSPAPFVLEQGGVLPELTLAYHTYGQLNAEASNVIWVCHALTANSNVADWWAGLFGPGNVFDPDRYFIVCANMIGSCYGSTGPRSLRPGTDKAYGMEFPLVTMRDLARAQALLCEYLGINSIELCIGGSCGGHQVLELTYLMPERIKRMALLVCAARESAWAIAVHESQRLAIQADASWDKDSDQAGAIGLAAARAIGMLTYRTLEAYRTAQSNEDGRVDGFSAAGYIRHQADKLTKRFYAQCYWHLTKTLDTHHMGRDRGGIPEALSRLQMPAFVFSINRDLLIPPFEQKILAEYLPNAQFSRLDSQYGHDGFLIETAVLNQQLLIFLEG